MKLTILLVLLAQRHALALDLNPATLEQNTGEEMNQSVYAFDRMEIKSISENAFGKVWETLCVLNLTGNKLTSLPEKVFQGLSNLRELHLSGNKLEKLEPGLFHGLTNLEVLKLKGCGLESIKPAVFKDLTNLRHLDLGMNSLTSIDKELFAGLKSLEVLGLAKNNISSLSPGLFTQLENLRNLSLDHNQLKYVDASIFNMKNLKDLTLNENKLEEIDTDLILSACLDRLSIKNNKFKRNYRAVKFFKCMIVMDLDKTQQANQKISGDDKDTETNAAVVCNMIRSGVLVVLLASILSSLCNSYILDY